MEKILQQYFLNNTIGSYLLVFGSIVLAIVCKRLISKYFANLLYKMVGQNSNNFRRKAFLELVVQPLDVFLVLLVSLIAIDELRFPQALDFRIYHITVKQLLDSVGNGTLIVIFIWLCIRVIDFIALMLEEKANLTSDQTDNQLIVFFKDFFKVILVIIGVLLIFRFSFNKDVSNLLTGLSIVGAAIALATRESMENLIASFIIFFDKPFATGDLVKGNNFSGYIEKIGLRSTRIRTLEKTLITVPNKQMVDTIIDNVSLRLQRKGELKLEISLKTSGKQIQDLIQSARTFLAAQHEVENFMVALSETGKNAHIISIDYFAGMTQNLEEFIMLREKINLSVIDMMEQTEIEFAASNVEVVLAKHANG
ncbi:MAG: mechanosensitive ion channel family protein [Chitinophagaceae bacterium]|nr:mechanosensitive ion channel family protein [Chitinophagaceae bacterium]